MSDDGWQINGLSKTEALAAQSYIDGLRNANSVTSTEVRNLEERIDSLEEELDDQSGGAFKGLLTGGSE